MASGRKRKLKFAALAYRGTIPLKTAVHNSSLFIHRKWLEIFRDYQRCKATIKIILLWIMSNASKLNHENKSISHLNRQTMQREKIKTVHWGIVDFFVLNWVHLISHFGFDILTILLFFLRERSLFARYQQTLTTFCTCFWRFGRRYSVCSETEQGNQQQRHQSFHH